MKYSNTRRVGFNHWSSFRGSGVRVILERVQKAALKVILKNDYNNYEKALKLTGLQSLDDRRETLLSGLLRTV